MPNPNQDDIHQAVAQNATDAGIPTKPEQVKPTSAEAPVNLTQDVKDLGARIVNPEDLESGLKDIEYMMGVDVMKGDPIRTGEAKNPFKMLVGKLKSMARKQNKQVEET